MNQFAHLIQLDLGVLVQNVYNKFVFQLLRHEVTISKVGGKKNIFEHILKLLNTNYCGN